MFLSSHVKVLSLAATLGLCLFTAKVAHAQNLVLNGSFENPHISPAPDLTLSAGSSLLTDWTIGGDSIDVVDNTLGRVFTWQSEDGSQSLDLSGNNAGSISQTLATAHFAG